MALVLSRQRDESVMIGDDIEVICVDIRGEKVRLGFNVPRETSVHRKEIYDRIRRDNASRDWICQCGMSNTQAEKKCKSCSRLGQVLADGHIECSVPDPGWPAMIPGVSSSHHHDEAELDDVPAIIAEAKRECLAASDDPDLAHIRLADQMIRRLATLLSQERRKQ